MSIISASCAEQHLKVITRALKMAQDKIELNGHDALTNKLYVRQDVVIEAVLDALSDALLYCENNISE